MEGMSARLDEDTFHSEMMTKLLVYILCYRKKEMPIQELTEALWDEDESDNPTGALKNLMYRLRNLLKKTWGGCAVYSDGPWFLSLESGNRSGTGYREL